MPNLRFILKTGNFLTNSDVYETCGTLCFGGGKGGGGTEMMLLNLDILLLHILKLFRSQNFLEGRLHELTQFQPRTKALPKSFWGRDWSNDCYIAQGVLKWSSFPLRPCEFELGSGVINLGGAGQHSMAGITACFWVTGYGWEVIVELAWGQECLPSDYGVNLRGPWWHFQKLSDSFFFFFVFFFFCLWMWRKKIELKSPKLHTQGPPGTARAALGSMPVPPTTAKNRGILILRPMSHPTLELRHGPRWSSP